MKTEITIARESGLILPLAAVVAAWRSMPAALQRARSVDPLGAAVIFGLAWSAGYLGSVAALGIVAALLVGLYLARLPAPTIATVDTTIPATVTSAVSTAIDGAVVKVAPHPMADAFAGLAVRKIELAQPAANGRAKAAAK